MNKLIAKIFIAYWLAAGVVIAISDFEPHRHIHNPELTDALDASLAANARTILHAYEAGGCASAMSWLNTAERMVPLPTRQSRMGFSMPNLRGPTSVRTPILGRSRKLPA